MYNLWNTTPIEKLAEITANKSIFKNFSLLKLPETVFLFGLMQRSALFH